MAVSHKIAYLVLGVSYKSSQRTGKDLWWNEGNRTSINMAKSKGAETITPRAKTMSPLQILKIVAIYKNREVAGSLGEDFPCREGCVVFFLIKYLKICIVCQAQLR